MGESQDHATAPLFPSPSPLPHPLLSSPSLSPLLPPPIPSSPLPTPFPSSFPLPSSSPSEQRENPLTASRLPVVPHFATSGWRFLGSLLGFGSFIFFLSYICRLFILSYFFSLCVLSYWLWGYFVCFVETEIACLQSRSPNSFVHSISLLPRV